MTLVVAAALTGCGGQAHGRVSVTPTATRFDQPVHIVVKGVGARRRVTVELRSVDASRVSWSSHAVFRSTSSGTVDLSESPSSAGSYVGVNAMGLVDALSPGSLSETGYSWQDGHPQRFTLRVLEDGRTVARGAFSRDTVAPGVSLTRESLAATGFYGEFITPAPGGPRRPAVLAFGGSEGGLGGGGLLGVALAAAGYPTLDLAYFGEPGLPRQLKDIPLGYFARALRWLARRPGVRAGRIVVAGASRGSEAALLLGVHYPHLVHGVIASSPSDLSFGSYPVAGSAAWTYRGRPVPYSQAFSSVDQVHDPSAEIAVQRIRAPVLLDCGSDDQVWTSCAYAQAIQRRLAGHHDRFPHVLYRYRGAGHGVSFLFPYEPASGGDDDTQGDTELANPNADVRLWPHVLSFLAGRDVPTGTFTAPATPPPARTP